MGPEKEEREDRDADGHGKTLLIEEDMIEHDVYDDRAEQSQAERNETPTDEQK